jgi:hypothetical protein
LAISVENGEASKGVSPDLFININSMRFHVNYKMTIIFVAALLSACSANRVTVSTGNNGYRVTTLRIEPGTLLMLDLKNQKLFIDATGQQAAETQP